VTHAPQVVPALSPLAAFPVGPNAARSTTPAPKPVSTVTGPVRAPRLLWKTHRAPAPCAASSKKRSQTSSDRTAASDPAPLSSPSVPLALVAVHHRVVMPPPPPCLSLKNESNLIILLVSTNEYFFQLSTGFKRKNSNTEEEHLELKSSLVYHFLL
jgi:hypothetical protein